MEVIASAPGKVFVVGEYGVVEGGPAVVATVTRRLETRVRALSGAGELRLQLAGTTLRRPLDAEQIDDVPAEARFVAAAAMVAARVFALRGTDLEIATASDLDPGATKTGLGGSAAVTAATVSAVQRIACPAESPMESTRTRVATALYAHRLAQGGGSGADVVASSAGGLVWIDGLDGGDVPASVGAAAARARIAELRWAQLELPATLALDVVATGRSCATGPRVARYRAAFAGPQGHVLRAWAGGMRAATEIFRDGCRTHDAATVLRATRLAGRLLSRLGAIAGLRVYTPELRRACVLAAAQPGCAGKPSGAGGGDCAIAIVTREQRPALRGRWSESGLFPLDVDLEPRGAACEVVA
ncbi:hypothetical protein K2Z84_24200 [Candidatus Binatia bacterium]|nr:hypothetical protein [Candidatus Binatia bacterium]